MGVQRGCFFIIKPTQNIAFFVRYYRSSSELVLYVQDFVDVEVALSQSGLGLRKGVIR
jgi:hypothetical protein